MADQQRVVSLCQHVIDGKAAPEFLFGHRSWTIAAFCPECEVLWRKLDEAEFDFSSDRIYNPFAEVGLISVPAEQAYAMGIPENVGSIDDEASVYGK